MDSMPKLIAVAAATLVLHAGIYAGFFLNKKSAKQTHSRANQARESQWSRDDKKRERDQEKAREEKLGATPEERKQNDPEVDILGLLTFLAQQAKPGTASATVEVDRFTEFSVYLKVISMLSAEDRAQYLRAILSRVDPAYVFQVAFVEEDGPSLVADQSCLLQIKDWSRAGTAAIERACF